MAVHGDSQKVSGPEINNAKQYLDYVQTLYNRQAEREQKDGFTVWALLVALVFVIWDSISKLSEVDNREISSEVVILFFSHIHVLVIVGLALISLQPKTPLRVSDYRVSFRRGKNIYDDLWYAGLLLIIPGLAAYASGRSDLVQDKYVLNQLSINAWLLLTYGLIMILAAVFIKTILRKADSMSNPFLIPGKTGVVGEVVWLLLIFELAVGNAYALIVEYGEIEVHEGGVGILLALNSSIVLIILVMLRSKIGASTSLVTLERLERDIVMHGIDAQQICRILEEEYLGRNIGDWLKEELSEMRQCGNELIECMESARGLICSGQVILATVFWAFQYCCSATTGGNPSLCECGLNRL